MGSIKTELRWALVFCGTMLAWMVLERAVGLHDEHIDKHMVYTNLFAIPAILVYVFALRDKKHNDLGGVMSYRQGFVSGMIVSVIIMLLSPGLQWIISTLITPNYFANVIEYSLSTGYHETRAEAEAYFSLENYMMQSAIAALIMGLVTTLIVAAFVRSRH